MYYLCVLILKQHSQDLDNRRINNNKCFSAFVSIIFVSCILYFIGNYTAIRIKNYTAIRIKNYTGIRIKNVQSFFDSLRYNQNSPRNII